MIDLFKIQDNFDSFKNIKSKLVSGNIGKEDPLLTICIPTYKRADTIIHSLQSVLNQKSVEFPYEVIVVDNEPGDDVNYVQEILERFNDPNILLYRNEENIGMFGNWNRCAELARGRWITYLHDDDILLENYLESIFPIITKMIKKNDVGYIKIPAKILIGSGYYKQSTKKTISDRLKQIFNNKVCRMKKYQIALYGNPGYIGGPSPGSLINRDVMLKVGGYNPNYYPSADGYLPVQMLLVGYKVYRAFNPLGYYRFYKNNQYKVETLHGFVKDMEEFIEFTKNINLLTKYIVKIFGKAQFLNFVENHVLKLASDANITMEQWVHTKISESRKKSFVRVYKTIKMIDIKLNDILSILIS